VPTSTRTCALQLTCSATLPARGPVLACWSSQLHGGSRSTPEGPAAVHAPQGRPCTPHCRRVSRARLIAPPHTPHCRRVGRAHIIAPPCVRACVRACVCAVAGWNSHGGTLRDARVRGQAHAPALPAHLPAQEQLRRGWRRVCVSHAARN